MATSTAPPGGESLTRLRAEAAALRTRAGDLERACAAIEGQISQLARRGSRSDPQRAARLTELRRTAQETVQRLEDVVRRRGQIRERIVLLERERATAAIAEAEAEVRAQARAQALTQARGQARAQAPLQETTALEPSVPASPAEDGPLPEAAAAEPPVTSAGGAILSAPPAALLRPAASGPAATPASVPARSTPTSAAPAAPRPPSGYRGIPAPTIAPDGPLVTKHRLEPVRPTSRVGALASQLRLRHVATALLSIALVALAALLTPLPELFGWQLFAVQSGSMEPAIPVGSIIAVQPVPAATLKVGDVITFADRNRPELRVTHRIVSLETREGQQVAITKGDANNTTDSWNVPLQSAIGRVVLHVPLAGYFVYWLSSPPVRLAALTIVVIMLVAPAVMRRRSRPTPTEPDAPRSYDEMESEIEALLGEVDTDSAQSPVRGPTAGAPAAQS